MDEILIYKVQEKRVLYDTNLVSYKDNKARNLAWDEIAAELGLKAAECRELWCKLRNCFNNARKRRLRQRHGNVTSPGKWKYENQMSFLIPFMGTTCDGHRTICDGNAVVTQSQNEPGSPMIENDINYTVDETVMDVASINDRDLGSCENNTYNTCLMSYNEDPANNDLDPLASSELSLSNTDPNLINRELPSELMSKVTASTDEITLPESDHLRNYITKKSVIVDGDDDVPNPRGGNLKSRKGTDTSFNNSDHSNRDKRVTFQQEDRSNNNVLTLVIKKPRLANTETENQDDCAEEEYYLRLAKMARKLKPPERIKLRDTVSRVVMDALINLLPES